MDLQYLQRREQMERAAAKRSACAKARAAHQEMAQRYVQLIQQASAQSSASKGMPA